MAITSEVRRWALLAARVLLAAQGALWVVLAADVATLALFLIGWRAVPWTATSQDQGAGRPSP